ncbi:uncharacterized protein LOC144667260 [Oculina patagonica]
MTDSQTKRTVIKTWQEKPTQSFISRVPSEPYRFSGWPVKAGSNGIPGIPGVPGIPGSHGSNEEKGTIRKQGLPGAMGIPGNIGPRGFEGPKGEIGEKGQRGPVGTKGSAGIPGNIGPRGFRGLKGENGMIGTKGEKGETADIDPRHLANWKQYTWRGETDTDNGKIKGCFFNKLHSNTALRVSYQGNIRVYPNKACNRWFFKSTPNILLHHSFEGFCENLARGTVTVELWVGKCSEYTHGDAYTGWHSVSRIMIEEVPPSQ